MKSPPKLHRWIRPLVIITIAAALLSASSANGENLINNGDFSDFTNGTLASWRIPAKSKHTLSIDDVDKPTGIERSLKVTINNSGQGLGQITQKFPVIPDNDYLLEGWVKSMGSEQGSIQIKLYSGKEEIERIRVLSNGAGWGKLTKRFKAKDADHAEVLLRYKQTGKEIGNELYFAEISVIAAPDNPEL